MHAKKSARTRARSTTEISVVRHDRYVHDYGALAGGNVVVGVGPQGRTTASRRGRRGSGWTDLGGKENGTRSHVRVEPYRRGSNLNARRPLLNDVTHGRRANVPGPTR